VPLPVELLVVPSLHVLGGAPSARLDGTDANMANDAAIRPAMIILFMNNTPWVELLFGIETFAIVIRVKAIPHARAR
jgi:hypothetical protein